MAYRNIMMTREQEIIQLIKDTFGDKYIGDDCAVLPANNQQLLMSQDLMIEGVHFLKDMLPHALGYKIASVNISDIASMGGTPLYFSLGMSLPEYISTDYIQQFMRGLKQCLDEHNVILTGGDLTAGDKLLLAGHITGQAHSSNIIAKRDTAQVGDIVLISGHIGNSGAGLYNLLNNINISEYQEFEQAHYYPLAQVQISQELISQIDSQGSDSLCMMDLSDGLLDSLKQISKQSQVRLSINLEQIPIHQQLISWADSHNINLTKHILESGEDYQLIATITSDIQYNEQHWTAIGTVQELTNQSEYIQVFDNNKLINTDEFSEFQHF